MSVLRQKANNDISYFIQKQKPGDERKYHTLQIKNRTDTVIFEKAISQDEFVKTRSKDKFIGILLEHLELIVPENNV